MPNKRMIKEERCTDEEGELNAKLKVSDNAVYVEINLWNGIKVQNNENQEESDRKPEVTKECLQ